MSEGAIKDLRTLTFTIAQLRTILMNYAAGDPQQFPSQVKLSNHITQVLEQEWHHQQRDCSL